MLKIIASVVHGEPGNVQSFGLWKGPDYSLKKTTTLKVELGTALYSNVVLVERKKLLKKKIHFLAHLYKACVQKTLINVPLFGLTVFHYCR